MTSAMHAVASQVRYFFTGVASHAPTILIRVPGCRVNVGGVHVGLPETSNSMMNSMLTAMRSGISAVGRRMGVNLPLPLRKMLDGLSSCHFSQNFDLPASLAALRKAYWSDVVVETQLL